VREGDLSSKTGVIIFYLIYLSKLHWIATILLAARMEIYTNTRKDCKEVSENLPKWQQTNKAHYQSFDRVVSPQQQWRGAEFGQLEYMDLSFLCNWKPLGASGRGAAPTCQLQRGCWVLGVSLGSKFLHHGLQELNSLSRAVSFCAFCRMLVRLCEGTCLFL